MKALDFAANLRAELAERGMTQQQLADAIGCTQTAISYYVRGRREPSPTRICLIADVFGVTVDCLLGREPRPSQYPLDEGDVTVIGPECFASRDRSVLSWRGENYVPQRAQDTFVLNESGRRKLADAGIVITDDDLARARWTSDQAGLTRARTNVAAILSTIGGRRAGMLRDALAEIDAALLRETEAEAAVKSDARLRARIQSQMAEATKPVERDRDVPSCYRGGI